MKLPYLRFLFKIPAKRLSMIILVAMMTLIVIMMVFLSPKTVDDGRPGETFEPMTALKPEEALQSVRTEPKTQVPGIPPGKIPEYSIQKMNFTSAKGDQRDWKLKGEIAHVFRGDNIIYSKQIILELYGSDQAATHVTGEEAKYTIGQRDIEIYGNVKTVFPDGFEMYSQYLHYQPGQKEISIPDKEPVSGIGDSDEEKTIAFESNGMRYSFGDNQVQLLKNVKVTMIRKPKPAKPNKGEDAASESDAKPKKKVEDKTTIYSDYALIERNKQVSHFTMYPERPIETRFVRIEQPDTFVRSRRADLHYGDSSDLLQYMTAYDDVFIREFSEGKEIRYATCGLADFDSRDNTILLRQYPQVYQGDDTVTGDKIRIFRDTDVVEIDHSNAYSEGKQKE